MKQSIGLFVMLFLLSCSNGISDIPEQAKDKALVDNVSIITTEYQPGDEGMTRGLTYTGNAVPFAWTEKDTLGIFPNEGDQMAFSMSEGIGTTNAKVDGGAWALKTTAVYYAYSPFNRWNFFRDKSHVLLDYTGQEEDGIATTDHLGAYDFQAANSTLAVNGHLNFTMNRLGHIWILRLLIPQAGTYTGIKVSADEPVFTIEANLALGSQYVFTPTKHSKSIALGLKNVTTTEDGQLADFLLMMAPVDLTGRSVTVSLMGANGYEYKATRTDLTTFLEGNYKRTRFELVIDDSANIGIGGEFEEKDEQM